MRRLAFVLLLFMFVSNGFAQIYKFKKEQIQLDNGFFTIPNVPDGNYRVHVKVGSATSAGLTTVRGESRRLFYENVETKAGAFKDLYFTINKRNTIINDSTRVKIKKREENKKNWDNNLTFEFNGKAPQVEYLAVSRIDDVTTLFLCGNSTVVDQDNEPWASWGQMIPRFFNEFVSVANYAESGESSNTFIGARRLEKLLTQVKPGDYIMVEFGHNDEKQKGEDKGPYKHFTKALREYITEARKRGAIPVLITPTQRRAFDESGKLKDTHGEFPAAIKKLAEEENVALIDLQAMTTILYETLGVENSKKALVHYPAGTFPGQTKDFADNTHFNPYGAYQIAKCVIEGMIAANLDVTKNLRKDYKRYNPAKPDKIEKFQWDPTPFVEIEKPDGN